MTDTKEHGARARAAEAVDALRRANLRLATAESCTGGLIAKLITDIPGASDVFVGSVVSYSNDVKSSLLGVPEDVLRERGAVSRETALYMADGARRACHADIAVSTTGIAGPGGGTKEKPVGTVWVAVSCEKRREAHLLAHTEDAGREAIRLATAEYVLRLIYETAEIGYGEA